ncbi:ABC transporter ATP-binding protein [Candidatus Acetothermia bacterium]|jgi:NitT/TauT family transport system ATP-binding protein|nr:ABC transporter ATP-binding protein [Candidatus Acetothermia bacterium]MCI2426907.1 ABC transporter ATP-binding protein [Candidatus Acetothermia bacterium]MCI2427941.1 ABC transporter ATP-binding protein [Candidatus Acetothermia bacterium]
MSRNKIVIENVSKHFTVNNGNQRLYALDTINLTINEGEFFCLLGPSGCGKSTLLNILAGFLKPTEGRVLIDGEEVTAPNPKYVTIFQEYTLFPWRTVLGNVKFGLEIGGMAKQQQNEIASSFIKLVQLQGFEDRHPFELSGGMKQRVAIARTLAVDPEIIFMDEPFGSLDAITRMEMEEEITRIWQEENKTIVFVTHDIEEAIYLADRIAIMSHQPGRIDNVIRVNLGRPKDRTSDDFLSIRDKIYDEFKLKTRKPFVYQI